MLALDEKTLGSSHPETATDLGWLTLALQRLGRLDEALLTARRGFETGVAADGSDILRAMMASLNLAKTLVLPAPRATAARPLASGPPPTGGGPHRASRSPGVGFSRPIVARDLGWLALVALRRSAFAQAESRARKALVLDEKRLGAENDYVAWVSNGSATLWSGLVVQRRRDFFRSPCDLSSVAPSQT